MFRKERYIIQRKNSCGYSFLVRIRTDETDVAKTFNEKDYPSAKIAFETAVNFRDKTLYEIRNGMAARQNNSTVQNMFDYYLNTTTDSYKTKRKHTYLFNKYVHHKDVKMQQLTKAQIQEDMNAMVEIASKDTISKVYSIWKNAIVNNALLQDILVKDIMLGVKKPESKKIHIKKSTDTNKDVLKEVEKLIIGSMVDKYDARIINFLLEIMYYTGMRPCEVIALTRKDITRSGISITKEIGSSRDDVGVVRRCKSPDSIRLVPIHPELKPILEDLMDFAETEHLFYDHNEHYLDTDRVGNIISRLCKKNKIKFNMYRLRHNMATSLVTNNVDQKTTIELLGHANYDMSLYYASSNEELKEEAIKYLS